MVVITKLFDQSEVDDILETCAQMPWQDGTNTAMGMAADVKNNNQASPSDPMVQNMANVLLAKIGSSGDVISSALPLKIFPPVFNRYQESEEYGYHVDAAIMRLPNSQDVIRSDVSMTVFLSDPESYDGGELILQSDTGEQVVKLPAGYAVIYPSHHLHKVTAVTRGTRHAAITWMQSMVPDISLRSALYDLDKTIQTLIADDVTARSEIDRLNNVYHNLVRQFSQV